MVADTTYFGRARFKQCEYSVTACNGGTIILLPLRNDLRNHSPDGFSWGYNGSGPAQLALALLADATGSDEKALKYYQRYKAEIVSRLPENWELPIKAVSSWVHNIEKEITI